MMNKSDFQKKLLYWYDMNQRILPWRDNLNPYYIWVSEIMLQQTKVQTVIPYFDQFIKRFPTIQALAVAKEDEYLKLWEGLGYYNRVRNLNKAAQKILLDFGGIIPNNKKDLESLSGIGPYTSGAILSIAFNKKYSAVDGNVLRVFARLFEIKENIKDTVIKKSIKGKVESLLPNKRIGDFNQALMEIGATVCLPNGKPLCSNCPLSDFCLAFRNSTTLEIPLKRKKAIIPQEELTVFILKYKNKFAIEKRNNTGLLASMYQFPIKNLFITQNEIKNLKYGKIIHIETLGVFKHKFTHKEWLMKGYFIELSTNNTDYEFVSFKDIKNIYTIPSAFKEFKKIIRRKSNE